MSNNKEMVVKKAFRDKETKEHFAVGSLYSGDPERLSFLSEEGFLDAEIVVQDEQMSDENTETEFPKHTGGGWYELSNGERVKGKDEAATAEEELKELSE